MTSLIKHMAEADVQPIGRLDWHGGGVSSQSADAHKDPVVAALEAQIEEMRRAREAADTQHQEALLDAYAQGKREAETDHARTQEQAIALLKQGIDSASQAARTRFRKLDSLSLLLCDICLEKLFADEPQNASRIRQALRRHLRALGQDMVLRVSVSTMDFPDPAALCALSEELGSAQFAIHADAGLPGGTCRLELKLGSIDISLPDHWDELRAELKRLTQAEPSA